MLAHKEPSHALILYNKKRKKQGSLHPSYAHIYTRASPTHSINPAGAGVSEWKEGEKSKEKSS